MIKVLISTLSENAYDRLINYVSILPVINYKIEDFDVVTILMYLRKHIFSYHISRTLFDLTIRKYQHHKSKSLGRNWDHVDPLHNHCHLLVD